MVATVLSLLIIGGIFASGTIRGGGFSIFLMIGLAARAIGR